MAPVGPLATMRMWGDVSFGDFAHAMLELAFDDNADAHRKRVSDFCAGRWDIPFAILAAYLAMVWAARRRRVCAAGAWADRAFAAWNLSLALFSVWGALEMSAWLREAVAVKGAWFTVCENPYGFETKGSSHATLALFLFAFSKIPELGDTAFLILRGKPVRFLQWYHHSTVMLFCWLAIATEYTPGIWFAMTNCTVHAVMYMYFFLTACPALKRFTKAIAPLVTVIQITQMVYGLFINGFAVVNYLLGNYCHIQDIAVYSAVAMYASYFVLFSLLFLENRAPKAGRGRGGRAGAPAPAAPVPAAALAAAPRVPKGASAERATGWRCRAVSAGLL